MQGTTILDHKVINLFMLKRFRVSLAKVKMAKSFFIIFSGMAKDFFRNGERFFPELKIGEYFCFDLLKNYGPEKRQLNITTVNYQ